MADTRSREAASPVVSGRVTLDSATRSVTVDGRPVRLSTLSFDTLAALLEAAPAAVSYQALIDRAWGGAVVSDETVSQRIRLLRQALGDDGRQPRLIESVRGLGYRWIGAAGRQPAAGLRLVMLPALTLIALIVGAGSWMAWPDPHPPLAATAAPVAADYVAQGWTHLRRHQLDDNRLAQDLFSRALALAPEHAGARAGMSLALSQAVSKFNAPHEQAAQAEALARQVIAGDPDDPAGHHALAASLDARGAVQPAVMAYRAALQRGPDDAGVAASLAYLLMVRGELAEALRLSLAAAETAPALPYIELQIAETLRLLGFQAAAEPWLQRADSLRPDSVFAAETRARSLLTQHRRQEAATVLAQAIARGVRRAELHQLEAVLALMNGDVEAATAALREALSVDPAHGPSQTRLRMLADPPPALLEQATAIERAVADGDTWPGNFLLLAELAVARERPDEALAALERLAAAGYCDHRLLRVWPTLAPLRPLPRFDAILARMQSAAEAQRDRVLAAGWLPAELLRAP